MSHISALKDPLILYLKGPTPWFFPDTIDNSAHRDVTNHLSFPSHVQQTQSKKSCLCERRGRWRPGPFMCRDSFVRTICRAAGWLLGGQSWVLRRCSWVRKSATPWFRLPLRGLVVRGTVHWKVVPSWRGEVAVNKRSTSFPVSCPPLKGIIIRQPELKQVKTNARITSDTEK